MSRRRFESSLPSSLFSDQDGLPSAKSADVAAERVGRMGRMLPAIGRLSQQPLAIDAGLIGEFLGRAVGSVDPEALCTEICAANAEMRDATADLGVRLGVQCECVPQYLLVVGAHLVADIIAVENALKTDTPRTMRG